MARKKKQEVQFVRHSFEYECAKIGEIPQEIHLLPLSGFTGRDGRGPFFYNADDLIKKFEKNGKPIPIDLDHQSLDASEKIGPAGQAYGWVIALRYDPEFGMFGKTDWTPHGQELVASGGYRWISPVFSTLDGHEIDMLYQPALTNTPNLNLLSLNKEQTERKILMNEQLENLPEWLRQYLQLPITATVDDIKAEVTKALDLCATEACTTETTDATETSTEVATEETSETTEVASESQTETVEVQAEQHTETVEVNQELVVAKEKLETMTTTHMALVAEFNSFKMQVQAEKTEALIDKAIADGKIPQSEKQDLMKLDANTLETVLKFAKVQVPQGTLDINQPNLDDAPLTDYEKHVCKLAGLSEEAFKKNKQSLITKGK